MPKDPSAHRQPRAWPGLVLFTGGGAGLFLTAPAGAPWVSVYGHAPWAFQGFLGAAGVALLGGVWSLWAATRPPPPSVSVEAHVAFQQKTNKRRFDPLTDADDWEMNPRIARVAPAKDEEAFTDLSESELVDLQIQALREKIARAKVQFGMGKLSDSGYAEYVKELSDELGRLESAKHTGAAAKPNPKSRAWDDWKDVDAELR